MGLASKISAAVGAPGPAAPSAPPFPSAPASGAGAPLNYSVLSDFRCVAPAVRHIVIQLSLTEVDHALSD